MKRRQQLSRKRIQNNDIEDDPESQKWKGEDVRNVYQTPRRTKEQRYKQYTRRNQYQNNLGRRTDRYVS